MELSSNYYHLEGDKTRHPSPLCNCLSLCSLFILAEASRVLTRAKKVENSVILLFLSRHVKNDISHVAELGGNFTLRGDILP